MVCIYNCIMLKHVNPKPNGVHGQTGAPRCQPEPSPKRINSAELLGQHRVVEILHDGSVYQLRLTAAGKLILTK